MKRRLDSINIDPELMSGMPVFRGTRVPVRDLFRWLKHDTLEEYFDNFPSVNPEDVYAVLEYVAIRLPEEQLELEKEISGFVFPYEL